MRSAIVWAVLAVVVIGPVVAAAMSPLLEWREPIYIVAGFAGIIALTLLFVQPLLAAGWLPGVGDLLGRRCHLWIGRMLVLTVVAHVIGLFITSPPDVIDALLFVSPTPFSLWGVIAMWSIFATLSMVLLRRRLRIRPRTWRLTHKSFAVITVLGSVIHAMQIEGTMETVSKSILCALVVVASSVVIFGARRGKT